MTDNNEEVEKQTEIDKDGLLQLLKSAETSKMVTI